MDNPIWEMNLNVFWLIINVELEIHQNSMCTAVASAIYITKACHMIKINLLTSLSVDICFIYYIASFSVDSVSVQNMPSPCVVTKWKVREFIVFRFQKVNIYLINGNMPLKGEILPQVHLAKWVVKILITIYFNWR